jgi:Protein of unknown function (DUF433)
MPGSRKRMPVSVVFENLEDGMTIDELIELYDGLTREQVEAVLDFAARSLETPVVVNNAIYRTNSRRAILPPMQTGSARLRRQ